MTIEEKFDLQSALEEFFRIKSSGLTAQKLDDLYRKWEEANGVKYREALQQKVGIYARTRAVIIKDTIFK